ncbi:MAG: DUF3786 domain-containing protein [Thermodesulfobacteriota bacterium]
MSELRPVFGQIMEDYLAQLAACWEQIDTEALGVVRQGQGILVPLFNQTCVVKRDGIETGQQGLLAHTVGVLLSRYLLGPYAEMAAGGAWVSFREFKDSAPFRQGFVNTVERRIAASRSGDLAGLAAACLALGGQEAGPEFSYDLRLRLPGLPRVPLLLLFNDQDKGFPAQCSVLFQADAARYLDMECIAMLGIVLASIVDPKGGWQA